MAISIYGLNTKNGSINENPVFLHSEYSKLQFNANSKKSEQPTWSGEIIHFFVLFKHFFFRHNSSLP